MEVETVSMEISDYLQIVRRRWTWVVLATITTAVLAAIVTFVQTPQYESSARLFVSTTSQENGDAYQGGLFSTQRVQSYGDLASSRELANRVIDDLGLDIEPEELSAHVTAEVVPETVNMTIAFRDSDPDQAQRIAGSYSENLVSMIRDLETPPGGGKPPIKATIVDSASTPRSPVSPNPARNLGLGIILGLLVGVVLAVVRELLDTRVNSPQDLQDQFDHAVLGTVAYDPTFEARPLISLIDSHAPRAEAFRVLRTNLQFVDVDNPCKLVVISSAVPEEGKSSTAVNLAITHAHAGLRTLLVEGDLRRPRASQMLGIDNAVGVTNVLVGTVKVGDVVQRHEPTGLDVLASGPIPPNPAELIQSRAMSDLLNDLRASYDVVIIDAPPLLPVTDAALFSTKTDGTLLVVRHGHVTRDQVAGALERLRQVHASVVGFVLTVTPAKSGYYGYGYGYAPVGKRRQARTRADRSADEASSPATRAGA